MNQYEHEAKQRWGNTDAYREYAQRHTDGSRAAALLDAVFEEFAALNRNGVSPDSENAKITVEKLQQCITDNFYTCTDEILKGLGQLYVADERFKTNINKHGKGTAAYAAACIERYFE